MTPEDSLRLNVLLKQDLRALRIDEGKMTVHALTGRGEARIVLNPNCPDDKYLRQVREVISSAVLGVPHGYPAYLKRWTRRVGHARAESLEGLLKLGEPEALAAVVHASGLTDELASRAWWLLQSSDHARAMLRREAVVNGSMARVLAEFLVEFLAYEEQPAQMVESVRLVLQPGLIDEPVRLDLWKKGQRKTAYRVGFLKTLPDRLPHDRAPHPRHGDLAPVLEAAAGQGNVFAAQLRRSLDAPGQAYLDTVRFALSKCSDQGVVVHLFEAIEDYFAPIRPSAAGHRRIEHLIDDAARMDACVADPERCRQFRELDDALPTEDRLLLESLLVMGLVGEPLLAPIFGNTDAVGSGLRMALDPVTGGLFPHLDRLCP
ncbi:DsrS protein [Thioalkalivibrio paradoxus ARh 1]|uniref:DsrS protein n=1 Tax=Thioalkalivibrio paradoxus ARh 1 TaxID=713585 RepID=W0DI65_9GAMM|nr:DsrS protein [Thioalkalivibrio paradoxus ARh 1]